MKKYIFSYWPFVAVCVVMLLALLVRIPLSTFNEGSSLDAIGHFILPMAGAPLLFVAFSRLHLITATTKIQQFSLIFLLGVTAEALWEIFEFCVDLVFDAGWQPSNTDTMIDIVLAVGGSIIGGLLALYLLNKQK